MDGIEKPFNTVTEAVSVTDLAYFLNLASVIANARLETIREYPRFAKFSACKIFFHYPKALGIEMTLNDG
jgi:hypothetical protein